MWQAVFVVGLAVFAAFSWAVRYHFVSGAPSGRFLTISIFSAVNIFMFARDLWLRPKDTGLLTIALVLFVISATLFFWALHASRSSQLKLIYNPDDPQFILRSGPFRYIRHPFYAAYVPFWVGCAVATLHPVNIAYAVLLIPTLVVAAREEERVFDQSELAAEYADYRRGAGLFWPKFNSS